MTEKDYRFIKPMANIEKQGILASNALRGEHESEGEQEAVFEAMGGTISPELFNEIDVALSMVGLSLKELAETDQSQLAPLYQALNATGKDYLARKPILRQIVALVALSIE